MWRKLCLAVVYLFAVCLPREVQAISGTSCAVSVNGSVNVAVLVLSACSTNSVLVNPNINFVSGAPMPPGMLLTKSSSSGGNATWQVSGTPSSSGTGTGVYSFTDTNAGSVTMTITYSIVAPVAPTASLPVSTMGQSYPASSISATGGSGSGYTYLVTSGALPTGLSLASGGVISGAATASGTFAFIVQATDSASNTGSAAFSITIHPAVSIPSSGSISRTLGQSYTSTFSASGGTAPIAYSISSGNLPAGASLNSSTGGLGGTASAASSGSFLLTATDQRGSSATSTISYTISPTPLIQLSTPSAIQGVAYSQPIIFTGAIGTVSLTAGALPTGLALTSGGTMVSGSPTTVGSSTFTLSATDSNGVTASSNFAINVLAPLVISTSSLASGAYNAAYSATIAATGGTAPVTYAVTSGALPGGLSLSGSGAISGTPTSPGLFNFTITATDASLLAVSKTLSIAITAPRIVFQTSSLVSATQGTTYSGTVLASGGAGPLSYSITGGALPPGLSLSSLGAISGTPTTLGTFNFTTQAQDAFGGSQTASQSIVVSSPPLSFTTLQLPSASAGVVYSAAVHATGGSGNLTYSVSSGVLPAGMVLSSGGLISGTSSIIGTSHFTITAIDPFNNSVSRAFTIPVSSPMWIKTDPSLPATTQGAILQIPFETSGGTAPFTWTAPGNLPAGLSLQNDVLSGSPSVAGQHSFTIAVSDANGSSDSVIASLKVNPALTILNPTLGGPYSRNGTLNFSMLSIGGTQPLRWTIATGSLPPGITLNRDTGKLSGSLNATGSYPITLKLSDASASSITRAYTIVIANGPQILASALPPATQRSPYVASLEVSSALPIVDWQIGTRETFPPGLKLEGSNIIGTPTTPGLFQFEITVRDQGGSSANQAFTIKVSPVLELFPTAGPVDVPRGRPWSWTPPRLGGSQPFRFQLLNGTLPAGLRLDPVSGDILGTAISAGEFPFTIGITDLNNATAHQLYTFRCDQHFQIRAESLPSHVQLGRNLTLPISIEGGVSPYRVDLTDGALPSGLTLQASTIVGRPEETGNFTIQLTATDSSGASTSRSFLLKVVDGLDVHPRSLSFNVLAGSWFSQPHTLKWISTTDPEPVSISTSAPWLKVSSRTGGPNGAIDVTVEPPLLPIGNSTGEIILQSADRRTRIPVNVVKLAVDPTSWFVDLTQGPGGSWAALLQGSAPRIPFSAVLNSPGASFYNLSDSGGEIAAPDSFLVFLNPTNQAARIQPATELKLQNLMSGELQRISLPESQTSPLELSTSSINLEAQWQASISTSATLVVRSTDRRAIQLLAISNQPWLESTSVTKGLSPDFLLRFRGNSANLPEGSHLAQVQLYNQSGEMVQTLPVQLNVTQRAPGLELSSHSISLSRAKPSDLLRLTNPSTSAVTFTAGPVALSGSQIFLDRLQGEIPPGGEVQLRLTASPAALSSWSRHQVQIVTSNGSLDLVEIDVALPQTGQHCSSESPVMSFLNPGAGFQAQMNQPVDVRIAVRNVCGEILRGSVLALRIPKHSPASLYQDFEGIWHGVWLPSIPAESTQIEAVWLDTASHTSVSRYISGSIER